MSDNLIEYILISILLVGVIFYLLRYFRPSSPVMTQAILGKKVKNGYLTLLDLLYHNCDKDDFEREIREISIQRADNRYVGGYSRVTNEFDADSFVLDYFYEVLNYTDSQNKNFIQTIDLPLNIEEFNSKLRASLPRISNSIEFPILVNGNLENILLVYKKELNKYKIQMSYLSDGSDSYYFLLHSLDKESSVKKAIKSIGLQPIILN